MKKANHNILANLEWKERNEVRNTIIAAVLATDMNQHFKGLAELKAALAAASVAAAADSPSADSDILNSVRLSSSPPGWSSSNAAQRLICVEMAIHASDVGNPTKPLSIYLQWVDKVMEEFFQQGAQEQALGLPISAMCDRSKAAVERSQIGFIDFIVKPLMDTYAQLNSNIGNCSIRHLSSNREYYANKLHQQQALAVHAANTIASSSAHETSAPATPSPTSAAQSVAVNGKRATVRFK